MGKQNILMAFSKSEVLARGKNENPPTWAHPLHSIRVIYINMHAPRARLIKICRTKLNRIELAEGSIFLFRHTIHLYGDFSTEVNKESTKERPNIRV